MTKALVPRALLAPIVDHFKPQRVILFGSKARGEARRGSDIDLMVVVDDDTPAEKLAWSAYRHACRTYRAPADIFPIRAAAFERDRGIIGTLAAEAEIDGIVVYGSPKGAAPMKGPDPNARWDAVLRWLAVADIDRQTVTVCVAADPPLRASAAFHCQQAVEKLLKGFLTLAGKRSRKTHSLSQLGAMAEESFPDLAELLQAVEDWSRWVIAYRYPSENAYPEPDDEELRRALDVIDELVRRLRSQAPNPPP
jgi:HEPN domain-containing protein